MAVSTDNLTILYQDTQLIAVAKPAGLLVHRSKLDVHDNDNVLRRLREQCGRFLYPVHRLDKPTSGVLLFALDTDSARSLSQQFEQQLVGKHYLAVVRGYTEAAGHIDYAIIDRDARTRQRNAAFTTYQRLARLELPHRIDRYPTTRYSLLDIKPATGRRHQIRLHMKHIKHPLIGDTSYGKAAHNRFFAEQYGSRRLLLHAHKLDFCHPVDGREIELQADVRDVASIDSGQFNSVLADPRWQWDHVQVST